MSVCTSALVWISGAGTHAGTYAAVPHGGAHRPWGSSGSELSGQACMGWGQGAAPQTPLAAAGSLAGTVGTKGVVTCSTSSQGHHL